MSSCLAGRFSVVLVAGSWSDLHMHAWGIVRLFLWSDLASCVGIQTPLRPPCYCPFVSPVILSVSWKSIHPAGLDIFAVSPRP